jgi:aminoglycoside phosphotransferase (APT) family kinase protein
MPPARVDGLLTTAGLANLSGFNLPKIVGSWAEGGVVWIANVKGETVRTAIKKGRAPDTRRILDGLDELWNAEIEPNAGHPLDVAGGFKMTDELLCHLLKSDKSLQLLDHIKEWLRPFSATWQPTHPAHNDFHDDQLLITPEDELALVDFEETGPGDPMMDVGNMLAHLRWMAHFNRPQKAFRAYHDRFRSDALARFGWDAEELDLREAYSVFRLVPGPIRNLRKDWAETVETGLSLAVEVF